LKWWVWVTRQNPDGSWRLLIRKRINLFMTHPGKERESRFDNDILGYCDLAPDGTFAANSSLGGHPYFKPFPDELFYRLPPNKQGLADGWTYSSPIDDMKVTFKAGVREGDIQKFAASAVTPTDVNYQSTDTRSINFDTRRGLIVKLICDSKADWKASPWHSRKTIELVDDKQHDAEWIASLAAEGNSYLAAQQQSDALFRKAGHARTKAACQALLDDARRYFVECQTKSKVPEIRSIVDVGLKRFDIEAKHAMTGASKREDLYSKSAMDWETTGLDDKPQKLVDYRGKIVLLDFWYRSCGHCIEALPKVKKLVSYYEGKNVVVLGVNNDDELADAKFVVDTFQLKHTNIHANKIPDQYEVNAWPTFIVLDQTGRIADYHEGNSDDLYDHITSVVDRLLEHPPADVK
jgi:thiol-disulfide isomerase/thioredoxin